MRVLLDRDVPVELGLKLNHLVLQLETGNALHDRVDHLLDLPFDAAQE